MPRARMPRSASTAVVRSPRLPCWFGAPRTDPFAILRNPMARTQAQALTHPLDPLDPDEIAAVTAIIRSHDVAGDRLCEGCRFVTLTLAERDKQAVVDWAGGGPVPTREAEV